MKWKILSVFSLALKHSPLHTPRQKTAFPGERALERRENIPWPSAHTANEDRETARGQRRQAQIRREWDSDGESYCSEF